MPFDARWEALLELVPSAWELVALGVDAAVLAVVYRFQSSTQQSVNALQDVQELTNNKRLVDIVRATPNQSVAYAVVEGDVKAVGQNITSRYVPGVTGVMQTVITREHLIRWSAISRLWSESVRDFSRTNFEVPFGLVGDGRGAPPVLVKDPFSAKGIKLHTVYDQYVALDGNIMSHILDFFSGEKRKGLQHIERLLQEGRHLVAIGKLSLSKSGQLQMEAPDGPGQNFYLGSNISPTVLVRDFQFSLTICRLLMALFGMAGIGILAYTLFKGYKRFKFRSELLLLRGQILEMRVERDSSQVNESEQESDDEAAFDSRTCLICVNAPREVLLLECGHICMCYDCAQALPSRDCPVCRQTISRIVPAFLS